LQFQAFASGIRFFLEACLHSRQAEGPGRVGAKVSAVGYLSFTSDGLHLIRHSAIEEEYERHAHARG